MKVALPPLNLSYLLPLFEKEDGFMKMIPVVLALVLIVSMQLSTSAESVYVKTGSIGKQILPEPTSLTTTSSSSPAYRPLEQIVGEKVIFLPKPLSLRHFGYQSFSGGSGQFGQPTYDEAVGRIGVVTKVSPNSYSGKITVQMEDNGNIYLGNGSDSVDGIALVSEIDYARKTYIGKTLWCKGTWLETYDENKEKKFDENKAITIEDLKKEDLKKANIKKYSPVKVTDVVAGWYSMSPVRFILRSSNGQEGYVDVSISGTNASDILRNTFSFGKSFLLEDPRKKYRWNQKVWAAIEKEKVFIGMTADQAKMSWGEPKEINKTITGKKRHEQWVYSSSSYLYFDNGVLTAIQN
ncbi:hypothetical protein [Geomesophilobacter sediminis]|uniref:Uncharacterized protein n=1 Tax=Geomesophilobacter sediminis TaxID=2798584 RepID=A0A8J7S8I9_9BACT|nr:hypothetical protein [Geomesophilobacter sediminis]MBJ6727582.1 hypothetical protein [Geomesophilobacter sediminis]